MPITRVPCTLPRSETREFVRITDLLDGQEDCSSSLDEQTSFVEVCCYTIQNRHHPNWDTENQNPVQLSRTSAEVSPFR